MLRISTAHPTMCLFLVFFLIFYSPVNSLAEVNTTTVKLPSSVTLSTTVKIELAKNSTVSNQTRTTESTLQGKREPEINMFSFFAKTRVIGDTCNNTDDCSKQLDSICLNGACQCKPGFITSSNNRTCLKKATKLEDVCTEDVQCDSIYRVPGLAVCVSFRCVCSANANLINNNCYKKTVLGGTCKNDEDCSSIPYSYCFQGVCACDPDFSPDENGTHCYPVNGTRNGTNIDCSLSSLVCKVLGEDAYCSNQTCVCFPGFHLSSRKCVPETRLNEYCNNDNDCIVDMKPKEPPGVRECKNQKCSCVKGYKSLLEHNVCEKSGSLVIQQSLLLIMACLFFLIK